MNSRSKKRTFVLVLAPILVIAGIAAYLLWPRPPKVKAGVYLAEGGMGYLVISYDERDGYQLDKIYLNPALAYKLDVWSNTIRLLSGQFNPTGAQSYDWVVLMTPSKSRRDDWVAEEFGYRGGEPPRSAGDLLRNIGAALRGGSAHPPLMQPLPYLHYLNDPRVVKYFDLQTKQNDPKAALETAKSLLKDFPDDLYVREVYLSAAEAAGDLEEIRQRMKEWKSDFEKSGDMFLQWQGRRFAIAGRNAFELCEEVLAADKDLQTRLRMIPKVLEMEGYLTPQMPGMYWRLRKIIPIFLERQVGAKVCRVITVFQMLEGKRQESLRLLAANYRLGQFMMGDTVLIGRLMGVAVKAIVAAGLEVYALNCCESEAEFKQLWEMLERLEEEEKPDEVRATLPIERPYDLRRVTWFQPNFDEAQIRVDITHSRFELVRMSTAAKYRLVFRGNFPKTAEQFGPLLPDGPPKDPFGDGPLRFLATTDSITCYSIGPDKSDDRAAFAYDPTNGTISPGDIWIAVPRQRQYPFPREGVRAASVEDLMRQFPNGLPPDPFATTRGKGLGTTMTAAGDVYVFSYGPDVDEFKILPASDRVPQCHYDPTNGTMSAGDLFIRLPKP
jgi:hypothetical protein